MNRAEAGRGSVRKEIADKLRRGGVIAAARKKRRVFDFLCISIPASGWSLPKFSGSIPTSSALLEFSASRPYSLMPLTTIPPSSLAALTTVPAGAHTKCISSAPMLRVAGELIVRRAERGVPCEVAVLRAVDKLARMLYSRADRNGFCIILTPWA